MLDQEFVFRTLSQNGIHFFVGVPDSYLNGFCHYALQNLHDQFIIAANEGNAVGLAAGHYFATGEVPLVYLQNSGLGNVVNPLASLADEAVYGVPMLLLIGWRGEGNTEPTHPQHKLQGEITPGQLELLKIPHERLNDNEEDFADAIKRATFYCKNNRKSFALLVPRGVMAKAKKESVTNERYAMTRKEAMEVILDTLPRDSIYCATTGRTTRELFFLREKRGENVTRDFLNVGAMGHLSSVAQGIAMEKKERKVVALDGDGSAIMHLGAFTMAGKLKLPNFLHVVLNNGAHESVGGQPTVGFEIDFTGIAKACGYETIGRYVSCREDLEKALVQLQKSEGATFLECRIKSGIGDALPPIEFDHGKAIDDFMKELRKS